MFLFAFEVFFLKKLLVKIFFYKLANSKRSQNFEMKKIISVLLLVVFTCGASLYSFAGVNDNPGQQNTEKEKLKAGDLIIGHLLDEYNWHFFTWKGKHVGIDLPLILIEDSHVYCFSSKHFHHGDEYVTTDKSTGEKMVFRISEGPQYKGKAVRIMPDGSMKRPIDISITKNVCALFISCTIIIILFLISAKSYKQTGVRAPKGVAALLEPLVVYVREEIAKKNIGENRKKSR